MALQTSGQISLNDINIELGNASGTTISMNDSGVRGLIGKADGATMSLSEWYGAANEVTLTSAGTVNGQQQRQQITASSFVSSGGTLVIPSNIWIWSSSTGTAALTIDIPCTIKNSGKIIGCGGDGGGRNIYGTNTSGGSGGPAIRINSGISGVTIINYSGAYIAGGGGGGGTGGQDGYNGGGGGGAGGGSGGNTNGGSSYYGYPGSGGSLNASGGNASKAPPYGGNVATGGGAGGGGG